MFHSEARERDMSDSRFIAVQLPHRAEGVGRALQIAFRDGRELPADFRCYLDRLERVHR
jgi:hypothetical protein